MGEWIDRLKQEDEAWLEVGTSYNALRATVLAEVEERKNNFPSAKVKGKRKATEEEVALWDVEEKELPQGLRGKGGVGLAKTLCEPDGGNSGPLSERMDGLECAVRSFLYITSHL